MKNHKDLINPSTFLKGKEAIDRVSNLMENSSMKVDGCSSSILQATFLSNDGKWYGIVREGSQYILKVSNDINPQSSDKFEYINGVQNKSKYSAKSINEIRNKYNLLNIEYKRLYGDKFINESIEKAKSLDEKYVLKVDAPQSQAPQSPSDGMDDMGLLGKKKDSTPLDNVASDIPPIDGADSGMSDSEVSDNPDDYKDVDTDAIGGDVSEKNIQQLAGKLAYELREFDDDEKYSDAAKFAMSMTTSALQTDKISDDDKSDIQNKIDNKLSGESDESEETEENDSIENSDEDISSDELGNLGESLKRKPIIEGIFKRYIKEFQIAHQGEEDDRNMQGRQRGLNNFIKHLGTLFYFLNKGLIRPSQVAKNIANFINAHGGNSDETDIQIKLNLGATKPDMWVRYIKKEIGNNPYTEGRKQNSARQSIYDIDKDKILFDYSMDESESDTPYNEQPKAQRKNRKWHQNYFGVPVGRYFGDDDSVDERSMDLKNNPLKTNYPKKRNPFKYY